MFLIVIILVCCCFLAFLLDVVNIIFSNSSTILFWWCLFSSTMLCHNCDLNVDYVNFILIWFCIIYVLLFSVFLFILSLTNVAGMLLTCHMSLNVVVLIRIWGSHGGEYEDGCLLGCSAQTTRCYNPDDSHLRRCTSFTVLSTAMIERELGRIAEEEMQRENHGENWERLYFMREKEHNFVKRFSGFFCSSFW
jgi:hypothetical protein